MCIEDNGNYHIVVTGLTYTQSDVILFENRW